MLSNAPSPEQARRVLNLLAQESGCSIISALPEGGVESGRYVSLTFPQSGMGAFLVDLGEGTAHERMVRFNTLSERLCGNRNFPGQLRSAMVEASPPGAQTEISDLRRGLESLLDELGERDAKSGIVHAHANLGNAAGLAVAKLSDGTIRFDHCMDDGFGGVDPVPLIQFNPDGSHEITSSVTIADLFSLVRQFRQSASLPPDRI